jgi:calcineurin-like phosphoesterase family protein
MNIKSTFLIADLHLGHKNILKYENRPFANLQEQDKVITFNWNKVVKKEYEVYVLGDISFYPKEKTKEILSQLNGRKILVMGNHDKCHSLKYWFDVGFEIVSRYPICLTEYNLWLSHEPMYMDNGTVYGNIYGHVHSKGTENCVSVEMINYTPIRLDKIINAGRLV